MKRIYVVSLDDDVPLSPELVDNIKLLAHLVYEEIMNMECDCDNKILLHDNVSVNFLYENKDINNGKYIHSFKYVTPDYEPFMIGEEAFAFTVIDGALSIADLEAAIQRARVYIEEKENHCCKYKIDSVTYEDDPKNKNRLQTIKKLLNGGKEEEEKPKKRIKSILSLLI